MKTRVTGRVRYIHSGDKYVIEMRSDGIDVHRLHCKKHVAVSLDSIVDRLKAEYEDDATAKRDAEKERIRKKRDEGQYLMPFVMPAGELSAAVTPTV